MRISVTLATLIAAGIAAGAVPAAAATFTETFPFVDDGGPDAQKQDRAARLIGWCGGNAGDEGCNNPPGTLANNGGEGAVSSGIGVGVAPGFGFWSQRATGADSFFYTEKFPFVTTGDMTISWFQRDSAADPLHLAFRLGSTWYISQTSYTQTNSSTWIQQTVDLDALTFFTRNQPGATLPDGGFVAGNALLPLGATVDALGFWWNGPKGNTSRIDDISLTGVAPIPLPAALPLMAAGIGLLTAVGRRRRAG